MTASVKPEEISLRHALSVCGLSGATGYRVYIIPEMVTVKFI